MQIPHHTIGRSSMSQETTRVRSLELTVLSAENLRIHKKPIKHNAYVVVRPGTSTKLHSTKIDTTGENYPIWDEKLQLEIPLHEDHLQVQVCRRCSDGRECFIGSARIPVTDFIGDYTPEKYLHFLSYRLRDGQGEKNGIVNVSVRVTSFPACSASTSSQVHSSVELVGTPVLGQRYGTVTGVPVWRRS